MQPKLNHENTIEVLDNLGDEISELIVSSIKSIKTFDEVVIFPAFLRRDFTLKNSDYDKTKPEDDTDMMEYYGGNKEFDVYEKKGNLILVCLSETKEDRYNYIGCNGEVVFRYTDVHYEEIDIEKKYLNFVYLHEQIA